MVIHQTTCRYSDYFSKNLTKRSVTPRWPLTPLLLRSQVWHYPRIIVSKSHENMSNMWIQWPFSKTWTKGYWPLDDLWPQVCWGHMCDSTEGSLCPSPVKKHQSMWICGYSDPFFKNLNQKSLTPHLLRSYVWLYPSPMGIHQWIWIQWSILQNLPRLLTTYYILCTEWVITYSFSEQSSSLFLNKVPSIFFRGQIWFFQYLLYIRYWNKLTLEGNWLKCLPYFDPCSELKVNI